MKLTPREKDKLLISLAAIVAKNRLSKGIKLNYPEAIALITDFVVLKTEFKFVSIKRNEFKNKLNN